MVNIQKNIRKDEKEGMMVDMTKNKDAKMLPLSKVFPTKWRTIAPIIEADEGEGRRLGGHEGGNGKGKKKPYKKWLKKTRKSSMRDNFEIFRVFDFNNSGRISKEEWISTLVPKDKDTVTFEELDAFW